MWSLTPFSLGDLRSDPAREAGKPQTEPPSLEVGGRPQVAALGQLLDEAVLLARRLSALAAELHGEARLSGERRNLLRELDRRGPQTVPQLARLRSVTRQHVQALVNPLAEHGYVEFVDNPAHRRSHLVRLTPSGKAHLGELDRRETAALSRLEIEASREEIAAAAGVLRAVRRALGR